MKVVEIVWRDHSSTHGWSKELAKPITVRSIGYLASDETDHYCLVESEIVDEPDALRWGCSTAILKADVQSYREVAPG